MSFIVITPREREELIELFFKLHKKGSIYPAARTEAMTALRCLKAVHSNAIEDKSVDRIFLQVLLHDAGNPDKFEISEHYGRASRQLKGQEAMLQSLEKMAQHKEPFSISFLLNMHKTVFSSSVPAIAGKFRQYEVKIQGMKHRPPRWDKVTELLYQHLVGINESLFAITEINEDTFLDILRISAQVHFLVAYVHPFRDGNGRIARMAGDYAMLYHGMYYDVIMTDYRDIYLDALEASVWSDTEPLFHFLEYSYLETLRRISGFFDLIKHNT